MAKKQGFLPCLALFIAVTALPFVKTFTLPSSLHPRVANRISLPLFTHHLISRRFVKSEVSTALTMKNAVFCDITVGLRSVLRLRVIANVVRNLSIFVTLMREECFPPKRRFFQKQKVLSCLSVYKSKFCSDMSYQFV
jgi:hypothetical protein